MLPLAVCIITASCQGPDRIKPARDHRKPVSAMPQRAVLGNSVEGRPIESITFGEGSDVVLIMATIHGNEDAGTPLLNALADHLAERPGVLAGRKIILIPCVNPDGMAKQMRTNVRNVDLNRNFPASNFGETGGGDSPLSEPESAAIHRVLSESRPTRIVSLHQPLNFGSACIDFDGPGEKLAAAMESRGDLPITKLGSRPGSLGSYAGVTLGIPIITLELPKEAGDWDRHELWKRYGAMLMTVITFPEDAPTVMAGTAE